MLEGLLKVRPDKQVINGILGSFGIRSSRHTQRWRLGHRQRIRLHCLPPYCPHDNRVERKLWREVHANVTINHDRGDIDVLCDDVMRYMMTHDRRAVPLPESRAALWSF